MKLTKIELVFNYTTTITTNVSRGQFIVSLYCSRFKQLKPKIYFEVIYVHGLHAWRMFKSDL